MHLKPPTISFEVPYFFACDFCLASSLNLQKITHYERTFRTLKKVTFMSSIPRAASCPQTIIGQFSNRQAEFLRTISRLLLAA